MIKFSVNTIEVDRSIVETTTIVDFFDEELILTEINIKDFGHTVFKSNAENIPHRYYIKYHRDDNYFSPIFSRKVLIEKKTNLYSWLHWNYNFFEPIEIIGKGCELKQYELLFLFLANNNRLSFNLFTPETTLILKRNMFCNK